MYFVSGSNLFGQWFSDDNVFTEFRSVPAEYASDCDFSLDLAKLVQINWSYNIFQIDNKFYISGVWGGKESQLIKLSHSEECDISCNFIVGNDYKLYLVNKYMKTFWVMDLESKNYVKKINLSIEAPLKKEPKKKRTDTKIEKFSVVNDLLLCLTSEGTVYSGLLPSYLDTSHCMGKVIDVQCGYEHCMLLTDIGRVYTWGNGRRLQLGHGDVTNLELPTEIEALAGIKIVRIRAGGWHSLALSEFGDLYAWGWNDNGQLGINVGENFKMENLQSYPVPTLVDFFDENKKEINLNVKDMTCGSKHSAVLLKDNSLWTTGNNKYGQLGLSIDKYPSVKYFKKSFQFDGDPILMCGPWSTVVFSN